VLFYDNILTGATPVRCGNEWSSPSQFRGSIRQPDKRVTNGSADRRDQQTDCEVQSSASELRHRRQGGLQNHLPEARTPLAAATCSGGEVEEEFVGPQTSEASFDRGTPSFRNTLRITECMFFS